MSEPQNQHEETIFEKALTFTTAEARDAYLAGACGDNVPLCPKIEALIRAHEKAASLNFLRTAQRKEAETVHSARTDVPDASGSVIDRYKLLQKLGEGGFGVVYMAEQKEPVHRRVALKIIKLGMDTRQVVARFE